MTKTTEDEWDARYARKQKRLRVILIFVSVLAAVSVVLPLATSLIGV
jgi:hypothetical protein